MPKFQFVSLFLKNSQSYCAWARESRIRNCAVKTFL
uniref:Uncharacterized protein n=1 Tax=Anguilla anguilla TaxID=7936 RepID=A0A0E9U292_ANGAN